MCPVACFAVGRSLLFIVFLFVSCLTRVAFMSGLQFCLQCLPEKLNVAAAHSSKPLFCTDFALTTTNSLRYKELSHSSRLFSHYILNSLPKREPQAPNPKSLPLNSEPFMSPALYEVHTSCIQLHSGPVVLVRTAVHLVRWHL